MSKNNHPFPPLEEFLLGQAVEHSDDCTIAWREVFENIHKLAHDIVSLDDARALWLAYIEGRMDDFSSLCTQMDQKARPDGREIFHAPEEKSP